MAVDLYVDTDVGNDANAGDSFASGHAKATLQGVLDALSIIAPISQSYTVHLRGVTADVASGLDTPLGTTPTNFLKLVVDPADRHAGVYNTSKYRIESTGDQHSLDIVDDAVFIEGLQVKATHAGTDSADDAIKIGRATGGATDHRVSKCIVVGAISGSATGIIGINVNNITDHAYVFDNIVYGFANGADATMCGIRINDANPGTGVHVYGNHVSKCGNAIIRVNGNVTIKNNYADGSVAGYSGTWTASAGNASSDASSPQTGLRSIALNTSNFVNVTGGSENFHLAGTGSALYHAGVDTSGDTPNPPLGFTDDIDGQTFANPRSIGPDEVVSAAGATFAATPSCVCSVKANIPQFDVQKTKGVASGSAALTTQITMAATASGVCSTSAALTTAIRLNAIAAVGAASTAAALSTSIRMAAAAKGVCSTFTVSGNLQAAATGKCSTSATMEIGNVWVDAGLNFRASAGFVTDGIQEAPVLAEFFPHNYFVNGIAVVAGWVGTGPSATEDSSAAVDRRLAGENYVFNGIQRTFKVTLPSVGNYDIALAIGRAALSSNAPYVQLADNGVPFLTLDLTGLGAGHWYGADGVSYDGTTWPSTGSLVFVSHGFSDVGNGTGLLTITLGHPTIAGGATFLSHMRIKSTANQGALLAASAGCSCSTLSTITVPFSAAATCVCSTNAQFGVILFAGAAGTCSTAADITTGINLAAAAKGVCSTSATLTAVSAQFAARAGCSCSTPTDADVGLVFWDPNAEVDLAGYRVHYGTTLGGPYPGLVDVGLLQPNTLLFSDDMTNAVWTREGAVIAQNAHAPDGTLTAFELIQTVTTGYHRTFQTVSTMPNGQTSGSIYLKAGAVGLVMVRLFGDATHSYAAEFDLLQGIITPGSSAPYPGTSATMTAVGDGWYRCVVSGLIVAGPASLYTELNNQVHSGQYAGDASSSAYLFDPMIQSTVPPGTYVGTLGLPKVGYLVTGLKESTTYYFTVSSYDTSGNELGLSAEVSKFMPQGLLTAISMAAAATGKCSTSATLNTGGAANFASTSTCKASVTAALTTSIQLGAISSCVCSVSATLAVGAAAQFAAAPSGVCSVSAALTTAIGLATSPIGSCITIARLQFPPASFASSPSCVCSTVASLSTAITLASTSSCAASVVAAITTAITMAASATGSCSTAASLSTAITMAAAATGVCSTIFGFAGSLLQSAPSGTCSTIAALSTQITMAASASGVCSTGVSISGDTKLLAAAFGTCSTVASLTTAIRLVSSPIGACSVIASLTTGVGIASSASGTCSTSATLSTGISMASSASGHASGSSALTTTSTMAAAAKLTCSTVAVLLTAPSFLSSATGHCSTSALLGDFSPAFIENVHERWAERGIERGIFTGGG